METIILIDVEGTTEEIVVPFDVEEIEETFNYIDSLGYLWYENVRFKHTKDNDDDVALLDQELDLMVEGELLPETLMEVNEAIIEDDEYGN